MSGYPYHPTLGPSSPYVGASARLGAAAPPGGQAGAYPPGYHPAGDDPRFQVPVGYPPVYPGGAFGGHPAAAGAVAGGPMPGTAAQPARPLLDFGNDRFVKGLLIGAAAAYLLTNESVQRTAIKGAVKVWSGLQGGVEELKERFHDAEAELQAAASGKDDG